MPVIVDPLGTPNVVWSQDGRNVQEVSVAPGSGTSYLFTPSSHSTIVLHPSGYPITGDVFVLPLGVDIGTTIDLFIPSGIPANINAGSGDAINGYPSAQVTTGRAKIVKYGPTDWVI